MDEAFAFSALAEATPFEVSDDGEPIRVITDTVALAGPPRALGSRHPRLVSVEAEASPGDLGISGSGTFRTKRSGIMVPDLVRSEKLRGGMLITETALEAAAIRLLACDPAVLRILPRPHVLRYAVRDENGDEFGGTIVPDVLYLRRDGTWHAVRLRLELIPGACRPCDDAEVRALRAAYRRLGVVFKTWTQARPFARVRRHNCERMLRERAGPGDARVARVREILAAPGRPRTVAAVRGKAHLGSLNVALACLFELALTGQARLDMGRPFDAATKVFPAASA